MATPATFTVGKDCSAVLISPYGTTITLPLLTEITTTPEYATPKSAPLNSYPIERNLPMGHRLKFSFDRSGPAVDQLFSNIEANWWAQGTPDGGTNSAAAAYIYVNEPGGGTTTYQYVGVSLAQTNSGSISVDNPIKQEISGFAQTRIVS
jgi:hypothetical protein